MIMLEIVATRDGNHPFSIEADASEILGMPQEFRGAVHAEGVLRKHGHRYSVRANVSATAHLICDRSTEEFEDAISSNMDLEFMVDHDLSVAQQGRVHELDDDEVRGLREEDNAIDISDDVRQVLILALPLKRVAPAYRDKPLEEIFPMMNDDPQDEHESGGLVDERWAALAKLKRL